MEKKEYFQLIAGIIFHPAVTFRQIKRKRDQMRWPFAIVVFVLFTIVYVLSRLLVHFPFTTVDVRQANFMMDITTILVPVASWVLIAYLMSSILNGEMKLKEFTIATAYSLIPATALLGPLTLLSYLMENGQAFFYYGAISALLIWTILLFLGSFKVLNDYETGPFIKGVLCSLLAMVVVWCIVFLLYAIVQQMFGVIGSVFAEIRLLGK